MPFAGVTLYATTATLVAEPLLQYRYDVPSNDSIWDNCSERGPVWILAPGPRTAGIGCASIFSGAIGASAHRCR